MSRSWEKYMRAGDFYQKLLEKLTEIGNGDSEITLSIAGYSVPIKDIVWHKSCNEFHILPEEATEEEIKYLNRASNWMNN